MTVMATPTDGVFVVRSARRDRAMRTGAMLAFLGTLVIVGSCLAIWGGLGFPRLPMSFVRGPLGVAEIAAIALVYVAVGTFLIGRVPGVVVGWSLIVLGVGVGLHLPVNLLLAQAVRAFQPVPLPLLVFAWGLTSMLVPLASATIAMLVMVLPDGHLPSRRWRVIAAATLSGFILLTLGSALTPTGLIWFPTLPNPIPVPLAAGPAVVAVRVAGVGLLGVGLGLAAACLLARYRRGDIELRRQLRWVLAGGIFWAISLAALLVSRYLFGIPDDQGTLLVHIAAIGTLAVPITILIATVRYHMFGAQVIISRTLVYIPLLAIISGIYTAGVALSQRLFVSMTGNSSDVAIILATLMAAGAIMPLRRGLETVVDRIMTPARSGSAAPDAETTYRALSEQAVELASRLAEIEAQLAEAATSRRDEGMVAGEPGVGRTGWSGDPGA
jgi:hypothetical protein